MDETIVAKELAELLGQAQPLQHQAEIAAHLQQLEAVCELESWMSLSFLLVEFKSVCTRQEQQKAGQASEIWTTLAYVASFFGKGMKLLRDGGEDKAVFFAPLYNELRAIADKEFFSDHTLFFPQSLQQLDLSEVAAEVRHTLEQGITGLLGNKNKLLAFARINQALQDAIQSSEHHGDVFWRIMRCYLNILQSCRLNLTFANQAILLDVIALLRLPSGEHGTCQKLLKRVLYYISLCAPETNEERWCYQQYQLARALYRLPTAGQDNRELTANKDWQLDQCRRAIVASCEELASAPDKSWQGLYDLLLSIGHFGFAAKVGCYLDAIQSCNSEEALDLLAEINQQLSAGKQASTVIDLEAPQQFLDEVFGLLAAIFQEIEEWQNDRDPKRLRILRDAFAKLTNDADSIGNKSLGKLTKSIKHSLEFVLTHQIPNIEAAVQAIDDACNMIPDLADSIYAGSSCDTDVDAVVEKLTASYRELLDPEPERTTATEPAILTAQTSIAATDLEYSVLASFSREDSAIMAHLKATGQSRLNKIAEQSSAMQGKEIRFKVLGESIDLENDLARRMMPLLEQLLVDAITDGIETPELRVAANKSRIGSVSLKIVHESGALRIDLADDGSGLVPEKIQARTLALCSLQQDAVTEVASTLRELHGSIAIASKPGHGTLVTLRLPRPSTIKYVARVNVDGIDYAFPTHDILGVVACQACEFKETKDGLRAIYDHTAYQVTTLPELLREQHLLSTRLAEHSQLVLYKSGDNYLALPITSYLSNQEVVAKPLTSQLLGMPGVIGVCEFTDATLSLVLDLECLSKALQWQESEAII